MAAINAALWQIALIMLFAIFGLDAFAWFLGGMAFMFWIIVITLGLREARNEQAQISADRLLDASAVTGLVAYPD